MGNLLLDRTKVLPLLIVAIAIAVGSTLVILLTSSSTGGAGGTAAAPVSPRAGGAGNTVKVRIANFAFAPAATTVPAGTAVAWTNEDSAPHTATAQDGSFDTGTLDKGQTKSLRLEKPGTYNYVCTIHPFMHAAITVQG
jgi:plastocyanin